MFNKEKWNTNMFNFWKNPPSRDRKKKEKKSRLEVIYTALKK